MESLKANLCRGCGVCAIGCPQEAIHMEKIRESVARCGPLRALFYRSHPLSPKRTAKRRRKAGQAKEISKSVVVDSIETNNADMLQVARAFEAEPAFLIPFL